MPATKGWKSEPQFPKEIFVHEENPNDKDEAYFAVDKEFPMDVEDGELVAIYVLREVKKMRVTRLLENR